MFELFHDFVARLGLSDTMAHIISYAVLVVGITAISFAAKYLVHMIFGLVLRIVAKHSNKPIFAFLRERKIVARLTHLVPPLAIYLSASMFPPTPQAWIARLVPYYIIAVLLVLIIAVFRVANDVYTTYEVSKRRPIKAFLQVTQIVLFIIFGAVIVADLINESPLVLISGIGAFAAVFGFVFKDSLLGFVAGMIITSNDMVRIGDWIEVPSQGVDGDVIEIGLVSVMIENFDKTVTSLPAYALISNAFKNWRAMTEAGGRRIMRSVSLDLNSITFCSPEMLERFSKINYIHDYIEDKMKEFDLKRKKQLAPLVPIEGKHEEITNIGVFRYYITQYLKHHPKIHQDMIQMVRQLAPGKDGLPLQVYAFTNETTWPVYEKIQADIFDHILAVAPLFDLRLFQDLSGQDLRSLSKI